MTVTAFSYSTTTINVGQNSVAPTKSITGTAKSGPTYPSSNTSIATVNSSTGVVTGVAGGTVTITISYTNYDGSTLTKTCSLTIKATATQLTTTKITGVTKSARGTFTLTTTVPISKVEDAYNSTYNSGYNGNTYGGRFSSYSGQTIYHEEPTGAIDKITYTDGSYEFIGVVDGLGSNVYSWYVKPKNYYGTSYNTNSNYGFKSDSRITVVLWHEGNANNFSTN